MSRERDFECVIADLTKEAVELREQLATEVFNVVAWKQRAEAAEAKLKALDEQELDCKDNTINSLIRERDGWKVAAESAQIALHNSQCDLDLHRAHQGKEVWFYQGDGEDYIESMGRRMVVVIHAGDLRTLLYNAKPVPPVDVQELQAKLDTVVANAVYLQSNQAQLIAELERKLEDSTSAKNTALDSLSAANAQIDALIQKLAEQQAIITQYEIHELPVIINEQLAKAREEGRKEAVPDGIVWAVTGTGARTVKMMFDTDQQAVDFVRMVGKTMLAAAPNPEVKP